MEVWWVHGSAHLFRASVRQHRAILALVISVHDYIQALGQGTHQVGSRIRWDPGMHLMRSNVNQVRSRHRGNMLKSADLGATLMTLCPRFISSMGSPPAPGIRSISQCASHMLTSYTAKSHPYAFSHPQAHSYAFSLCAAIGAVCSCMCSILVSYSARSWCYTAC